MGGKGLQCHASYQAYILKQNRSKSATFLFKISYIILQVRIRCRLWIFIQNLALNKMCTLGFESSIKLTKNDVKYFYNLD